MPLDSFHELPFEMTSHIEPATLEPDIMSVIRERWRHILVMGLAFLLFGLIIGVARQARWIATASVVVEDPRQSTLFEAGSPQLPERYLQTQIEVLESAAVAQRASELLADGTPSLNLSDDDILMNTNVRSREASDLIAVSYTGSSAEEAESGANMIVEAYLELRQSEALASFAAALAQLDASIQESEDQLDSLDSEIQALLGTAPLRADLDQEYQQVLSRLIALSEAVEVDPDELTLISSQLEAMRTVVEIEGQRPELGALLEEQRLAIGRLSELTTRRNEVAVDAELTGGGVVFQSNARPAERTSPGTLLHGALGLAAGLFIGLGFAYGLEIRRRRFKNPFEPALFTHSPLLGAIPEFDTEMETQVPMANAPQSESAEAFRFVMAAVESQLTRLEMTPQRGTALGWGDRVIYVTSTSPGDGRTTLVANMAIAAARSGKRVLALDADFATQGLTNILAPGTEHSVGIAEVVVGTSSLTSAMRPISMGGGDLHLLSRGSDVLSAQDLFGSKEAATLLQTIRHQYDLVLVDSPPFHQVGYATTLARLADRVLVVVTHRSLVSALEELSRRLSLIHGRDIGYVYNRAPVVGELRRIGKHTPEPSLFPISPQREPLTSESPVFENVRD